MALPEGYLRRNIIITAAPKLCFARFISGPPLVRSRPRFSTSCYLIKVLFVVQYTFESNTNLCVSDSTTQSVTCPSFFHLIYFYILGTYFCLLNVRTKTYHSQPVYLTACGAKRKRFFYSYTVYNIVFSLFFSVHFCLEHHLKRSFEHLD